MSDYTPNSKETKIEKLRIIRLAKDELKEHGLVDLTDFINKKSTEGFKHSGFVRSVAYKMEELGVAEVIPQKEWQEFYIKRTDFSKRHPYQYVIILGLIGLFFSLVIGFSNAIFQMWLKCK